MKLVHYNCANNVIQILLIFKFRIEEQKVPEFLRLLVELLLVM